MKAFLEKNRTNDNDSFLFIRFDVIRVIRLIIIRVIRVCVN